MLALLGYSIRLFIHTTKRTVKKTNLLSFVLEKNRPSMPSLHHYKGKLRKDFFGDDAGLIGVWVENSFASQIVLYHVGFECFDSKIGYSFISIGMAKNGIIFVHKFNMWCCNRQPLANTLCHSMKLPMISWIGIDFITHFTRTIDMYVRMDVWMVVNFICQPLLGGAQYCCCEVVAS